MKNDDPEIEAFLKSFRLRVPRPLPEAPKPVWWRPLLEAAAVVMLALGVWVAARRSTPHGTEITMKPQVEGIKSRTVPPAPTLGTLQRLANTAPQRFNDAMDAQASALLPDVTRRNGALRVLAKE